MKRCIVLLCVAMMFFGCADQRIPQAEEYLHAIISQTDQIMADEATRLMQLSANPVIQKGEWEAIKPLLPDPDLPALYWYALPSGEYWTVEKDHVEANLSDRAYFARLLEGRAVVGSLIVGKTSGKKSTVVAVPVMQAGKVIAILGTSMYQDALNERLIMELELPADFGCFAIAPSGLTALHNTPQLIFDDILSRDDVPQMHEVIETMQAKNHGSLTYRWEGVRKKAVYRASPLSNWIFAITVQ